LTSYSLIYGDPLPPLEPLAARSRLEDALVGLMSIDSLIPVCPAASVYCYPTPLVLIFILLYNSEK